MNGREFNSRRLHQFKKMKNYIIAFTIMVILNLVGLFGLGFCVGIVMAISGNADAASNVDQFLWFNILVLFSWIFIAFFAFKFSVNKFIVEKI